MIIDGGGRSCLGVPLWLGERVGGALYFGHGRPHAFDASDVEIAAAVAHPLVMAVQHQRLADEQRRLALLQERAQRLERQVESLEDALGERYDFDRIAGRAAPLREALALAEKVAPTETTVLITGESGTGKELVARAIHQASSRRGGPFVAVNAAALPETLLESELFGHERGAFTGADRQRPGRFELARGGTLFLDEIGELSPAVQAKLLRVLQEREFQRVGGTATIRADVRLDRRHQPGPLAGRRDRAIPRGPALPAQRVQRAAAAAARARRRRAAAGRPFPAPVRRPDGPERGRAEPRGAGRAPRPSVAGQHPGAAERGRARAHRLGGGPDHRGPPRPEAARASGAAAGVARGPGGRRRPCSRWPSGSGRWSSTPSGPRAGTSRARRRSSVSPALSSTRGSSASASGPDRLLARSPAGARARCRFFSRLAIDRPPITPGPPAPRRISPIEPEQALADQSSDGLRLQHSWATARPCAGEATMRRAPDRAHRF